MGIGGISAPRTKENWLFWNTTPHNVLGKRPELERARTTRATASWPASDSPLDSKYTAPARQRSSLLKLSSTSCARTSSVSEDAEISFSLPSAAIGFVGSIFGIPPLPGTKIMSPLSARVAVTLPLFAKSNCACSAAICVASIVMVSAVNVVLWSFPKAKPASAVMTAATKVHDTATKEAARKNFNMKHTLKRRHQQTKLYCFVIVHLLLHPTRVFVRSPHSCPVRQPSLLVHRAFMMRRNKVN